MKYPVIILSLFFVFNLTSIAQTDCPILERASIAETQVWCGDVAEGYACYGNASLQVRFITDIDDSNFHSSGDVLALDQIASLTSTINRANNAWGIARLQTLTHRPDDWQTQSLTLILLGDATLTNEGEDGLTIMTLLAPILSSTGANLRRTPSAEGTIVDTVSVNERVKITGRTEDDIWLRVQRLDGRSAWMVASAVSLSNLSDVPIVIVDDATPESLYRPFSALTIMSEGNSACEGAPPSGLLIQAEDAQAGAVIRVNGRDLVLQGTLFVQADERITQAHVIEGTLMMGEERITGGRTLRYSAEDNVAIQSYDVTRLEGLPLHLLPRWMYLAVDASLFLTPRPSPDVSPLAGMLVDEPCRITTGETGANLRAGAGTNYPIQGVMAYRESARPTGRFIAPDGSQWWRIAPYLWVRRDTTVTGGDCISVAEVREVPSPPPIQED